VFSENLDIKLKPDFWGKAGLKGWIGDGGRKEESLGGELEPEREKINIWEVNGKRVCYNLGIHEGLMLCLVYSTVCDLVYELSSGL
jgi:hypothetical protein